MAEGTSLLRKHTGKTCIVGSNPTASARNKRNGLPCGSPFFLFRTAAVGFEDRGLPAPGSPNLPSAAATRLRRAPRAREACVFYKVPLTIGRRRWDSKTGAYRTRALRIAHLLPLRGSAARRGCAKHASSKK